MRRRRIFKRRFNRRPRPLRPAQRKRFRRFASKVLRVASEKKYTMVTTVHATPVLFDETNLAAQPVILTAIAEGDDDTQRNGRQVTLRSIEIHAQIIANPNYTPPGTGPWGTTTAPVIPFDHIRLLVWQWLPSADPSAASASDILIGGSGLQSLMPYDHDHRRDFRVPVDKRIYVGFPGTIEGGGTTLGFLAAWNSAVMGKFTTRLRRFARRELTYAGSASSSAANGHVFMSVLTDYPVNIAVNPFQWHYTVKTNFSDK